MSFQKHLTPEILADIIIRDKKFKGNNLIVEGKTDKLFFSKFISEKHKIQIAFGSERVISVVNIIQKRSKKHILGIIDSDFRNLIESPELPENIITTDTHDIETMIISSPAFENVYKELGSEDKIKKFEEETKLSLRENLLKLAVPIAYLKLLNHKENLELRFNRKKQSDKELNFEKFIDKTSFSFKGNSALIKTVTDYCKYSQLSKIEIEERLNTEMKNQFDFMQLCNGHDLVKIFSLGLKKKIGSLNKKIEDIELDVERLLRIGYDSSYFKETKLYSKIKDWQNTNNTLILSSIFTN